MSTHAQGETAGERAAGKPFTVSGSLEAVASFGSIFAPVRSTTAFEETVERLGTAIQLGLLPPGTRLPAERELCMRLGIARSTLRQALVALAQSGRLHATRGRGGGTFVADPQPPSAPPSSDALENWRETCDRRMTVEVGVAALAANRADEAALAALEALAEGMADFNHDLSAYRQADIRFHVGLAETTGTASLVAAMTEVQGAISGLIEMLPHSPELLNSSDQQHHRLVRVLKKHDPAAAAATMIEHLQGTEQILAGLVPGMISMPHPTPTASGASATVGAACRDSSRSAR